MVFLDLPELGLDLGQLGVLFVKLVLQSTQLLMPVLSQEVNLHFDSESSIRREEISDNTSGVRDTLLFPPIILGLVDISDSSGGPESFTL